MSGGFKPSGYPGVRYREHPTRRRGNRPDRYFVLRYTYDGKTHEEALGWASEGFSAEQASQVRGQLRQNQKTGRGPVTLAQMRAEADAERMAREEKSRESSAIPATFNGLADGYLAWARANKTDHASDERRLRLHIRSVLGDLPLGKIRQPQIEVLKTALAEKKLAPATVVHCVVLVCMIFNYGRRTFGLPFAEIVGENPTTDVARPKVRNIRKRYLKTAEVDTLLEIASREDPLMHDVILLCLYTGLRRGEVQRLQAMDIDFESRLIHVRDPKSGEDEVVDIPEFLVPTMERMTDKLLPGELVFSSWRTGGITTSMSQRFRVLVDAAGLNAGIVDKRWLVVFHTLRHTFITRLVKDGVDLRTVQVMARHRSFAMTLRYAHHAPGRSSKAVNRLAPPSGSNVVPFPAKTRRRS